MISDISVATAELTEDDRRLIERAEEATKTAFDPEPWDGAHMVGAALRAADGQVFTGVSMPANVGRVSMCAEPVALGNALGDGARDFETIVAVRHPLPDESRDFEVVAALVRAENSSPTTVTRLRSSFRTTANTERQRRSTFFPPGTGRSAAEP